MGTQAAGAYLAEHRVARRLSRAAVAAHLGTSEKQIERIDAGQIDTRSSLLLGYARLVGANIRRVTGLLLGEDVAADDPWSTFDGLAPHEQRAVIDLIRALANGE